MFLIKLEDNYSIGLFLSIFLTERWGIAISTESKHGVLLLHGLGGSPAEMHAVQRKLRARGFAVETPILPGHTTDYNDLRWVKWTELRDAAFAAFEDMLKRYETVSVSGLCLGAVLSLLIGIKYGNKVHSICPISTTLNFDGWSLPYKTRFLWIVPYSPLWFFYNIDESEPYGVKDLSIRQLIIKKMKSSQRVHYSKIPVSAIWQMGKMNKFVKKNLHKITCPVFAIHPREDEISSLASVACMENAIQPNLFTKLILENSYHLATVDSEKGLVAERVSEFFSYGLFEHENPDQLVALIDQFPRGFNQRGDIPQKPLIVDSRMGSFVGAAS